MKPDKETIEKLKQQIDECRTQDRALQIAANIVAAFTNGSFRLGRLAQRFGDKLCLDETDSYWPIKKKG